MRTDNRGGDRPMNYEITIEGALEPGWSDWFGGLDVESTGRATTISGPVVDQAALRGVLIKVWDLNLTLVSVRRRGAHELTP